MSTNQTIFNSKDEVFNVLTVESASILPKYTTIARDLIVSPENGQLIYNTTTNHTNMRNNNAWQVVDQGGSGDGDVIGPGVSIDNSIPRFNGTTGKNIQGSSVVISDTDVISGVAELNVGDIRIISDVITTNGTNIDLDLKAGTGTGHVRLGTGLLKFPNVDGTNGQTMITDGAGILSFSSSGLGDVVGPGTSTDNAICRYDGITGKLMQNSVGLLSDTGELTGITQLTIGNTIFENNQIKINSGNNDIDIQATSQINLATGNPTPSNKLIINSTTTDFADDIDMSLRWLSSVNNIGLAQLQRNASGVGNFAGLAFGCNSTRGRCKSAIFHLDDGGGNGRGSLNMAITNTTNPTDVNENDAKFRFNHDDTIDILEPGGSYNISGNNVLNGTTLGSGIVNSSLTNLGTLSSLTVDNIVLNASQITNTSGSLVYETPLGTNHVFRSDGNIEASISAAGMDVTTGDYRINGGIVLSSTTLGSGIVNSSITSTGTLNSGSISTGFGNINIGTGSIACGNVTVDNISIDGNTINTSSGDLNLDSDSDVIRCVDTRTLTVQSGSALSSSICLATTDSDWDLRSGHEGASDLFEIHDRLTDIVRFQIDDTSILFPNHANTASAANAFIDPSTNRLFRSTSALKYKKDVDYKMDTSNIFKLKPCMYRSKCIGDCPKMKHWGLIADEVEEFFPGLITYGKDKEVEGFQYERLPVLMLNEMKIMKKKQDIMWKELLAIKKRFSKKN